METAAELLSLILVATFLSTAATDADVDVDIAAAPLSPSSPDTPPIPTILSSLGFHDLADAAANISGGATPMTIFAPTDSSLLTCPSCSVPLLLQEHSLLGLYPLHFLRRLAFATKIETLAADRCLTITASAAGPTATRKVFVNGVEISRADFYNNGVVIVHALQGFLSHLSPRSCTIESMTSLSFDQPPTEAVFATRLMLRDAMTWLRSNGYSVAGLAIRVNYPEISELKKMTLFAMDDESIFVDGGGSHAYLAEFAFHVVPNRLLTAAELAKLPRGTALPTMKRGRNVVVTAAGDGGVLAPAMINYVKVRRSDMVVNQRIVVHGLTAPFRPLDSPVML